MSLTLNAALGYLSLGWSVLPIRPDKKIPYIKWKQYQETRPTETEIKTWFKKWPTANIGITTGRLSNLIALDFDSAEAVEAFKSITGELPATITQTTGRGIQLLFKYPTQIARLKNQTAIIKDMDLRAEGGLIVLPPSTHHTGTQYKWQNINPIEDGTDDLLDLSPDIIEFLQNGAERLSDAHTREQYESLGVSVPKPTESSQTKWDGTKKKEPEWTAKALLGVKKGNRNVTGTSLAGYFFRIFEIAGETNVEQMVTANLTLWNQTNDPPLPEEQLLKIIKSIGERHATDKLSGLVKKKIFNIQKLVFADTKVKYKFLLEDQDKSITLKPEELLSPTKFRERMMPITDKVMKPIKLPVWFEMVEKVLSEAQEVKMPYDETQLVPIRMEIEKDLESADWKETTERPEEDLKGRAIIHRGYIYITIATLQNKLQFTPARTLSSSDLGHLLTILSFYPSRFFKNTRTRRASLEEFKQKLDTL